VAYRCINYGQCSQEFETREERANHEYSCEYVPPPPPSSDEDQERRAG
jgi:hypothetical protein